MKTSRIRIKSLYGVTEQVISGSSVEITGKKGAGKTSILDAIRYALTNSSGLQIILIDGAEKLDDISRNKLYEKCKAKGLQFIATRTTNDSELIVTEL